MSPNCTSPSRSWLRKYWFWTRCDMSPQCSNKRLSRSPHTQLNHSFQSVWNRNYITKSVAWLLGQDGARGVWHGRQWEALHYTNLCVTCQSVTVCLSVCLTDSGTWECRGGRPRKWIGKIIWEVVQSFNSSLDVRGGRESYFFPRVCWYFSTSQFYISTYEFNVLELGIHRKSQICYK